MAKRKIVRFPASAYSADDADPINREPVKQTEHTVIVSSNGLLSKRFRLSIAPWDLQRIIRYANELGLNGKHVRGFGYDYNNESIHIVSHHDNNT